MTVEWTPKRTESLIKLWKSGVPTSEIGRKLKVTKNAVVGKAHRLGLPGRQSPIPSKSEKAAPRPAPRPAPTGATKAPVAKAPAPVAAPSVVAKPVVKPVARSVEEKPDTVVRLENLGPGMCAWPIGEPGTEGFHFCGKRPTVPDKPYCLEHCQRAYVKSSKDRKDSASASS
jgi:GcrA cell cycle regulator